MRIRILMVTNKQGAQLADAEMLKDRGFLVYNCTDAVLNNMIGEIKPDVVFINPENPGLHSTKVYHDLLDNANYADIPVIYALNEDDVYLVSRKRNSKHVKNVMTDNIVDGIKYSLLPNNTKKQRAHVQKTINAQLSLWAQKPSLSPKANVA